MRFLTGTATRADGGVVAIQSSSQRTLLKFPDGTYAVRENYFRAGPCPYLMFGGVQTLTVSIDGHSYPGYQDSTTANYIPFRKSARELPNTCIESVEHVLKCLHANAHQVAPIAENTGAVVSMSIGAHAADIDVDDMNDTAFAAFPHGLDNAVDATGEGFVPGDGMALVYSRNPANRGDKWTVHAVAVLLKSTYVWDRFVVVSEVFAPDDGTPVQMTNDWGLGFYLDAQDFRDAYFQVMKPSHYTLWKLSAAPRPAV